MKVIEKQKNSKMCVICGLDNPMSLKAPFYVLEDKSVCSLFKFSEFYQSYPGRVHGGLITAMLDELGGRAFWAIGENGLAVTTSLETKFRKPVPYDVMLKGIAKITKNAIRFFEAEAFIYDMKGNLLANANLKYLKMSNEDVCANSFHDEMPYLIEDEVKEIE